MKLINTTPYINGTKTIPSGAIPLADDGGGLLCIDACGFWYRYNPGNKHIEHLDGKTTQNAVLRLIIEEFSKPAIAERLEVTVNTIENWQWRIGLPPKSAQLISQLLLAN